MGLYKLCKHKGRARDRCEHAWWESIQYRGRLHRQSLEKWSGQEIQTKAAAQAVFDRMKEAIRSGQMDAGREPIGDSDLLSFSEFLPIYVERYVKANGLASADTIEYRTALLLEHFGASLLTEIKQAEVENFIVRLKQPTVMARGQRTPRVRKPATINRYLSLLRHMFNWAVEHEFLERSPMRRIRQLQEDNRRQRRLSPHEEGCLLRVASPDLRLMLVSRLTPGCVGANCWRCAGMMSILAPAGFGSEVRLRSPERPGGCQSGP